MLWLLPGYHTEAVTEKSAVSAAVWLLIAPVTVHISLAGLKSEIEHNFLIELVTRSPESATEEKCLSCVRLDF